MRLPRGSQLVVASHNEGKVREIKALLGPHGIHPISAGSLGLPEPEETGLTFAANAEIKALASAKGGGHAALADDSGLCVDALGGAPGIYSARWAGPAKDFRVAMNRIHDELRHKGLSTSAADAIVQYRMTKGEFKNLEELKNMPGLDFARIEARKNQLQF